MFIRFKYAKYNFNFIPHKYNFIKGSPCKISPLSHSYWRTKIKSKYSIKGPIHI